ncbi:hypothetical protein ACM39_13090 [Chryseobacterium sp. FH2]|uniref:RHS repeat-associated core domain-containing protein n=1 Tax=Chryseobacterium sp. FH2 TaxID=1674291 RepID=UPI00065ABEC6|nr:RHS repeat-associated core domain-containing protein [Chryseobacterium sp. FH2]KMQ67373.1 hypothetical protein ACM39_13090 [Chryseobacterium sp. FH2]
MWCKTEVAFEQQAFKTFDPLPTPPQWNLDFVPTAEGFYSFTENRYIYQYRDQLGNAKVSFGKNSEGVLETTDTTDTNNYYPFGLNHIGGTSHAQLGSYFNYKYNGKELQETGMYDYGARFYMPDIGRWGVVDPLAETSRRWSTYTYAYNNPIRFIDPDGRQNEDWVHNRQTNQVYWNNDARGQSMAGANETYLGKSGTYSAANGSYVNLNPDASFTNTSFNITDIGVGTNLDPLIQGGDNAPLMSALAFGNSNDPNAATIGPIPDSRGKTDIQMLVAEHPMVQEAALMAFTGGTGNAIRSILARNVVSAEGAVWAQKTFSGTFSSGGKFAGQTVDDVAAALGNGTLSTKAVPINVVVRDGQTFILNTRSSAALMRAGVPRSAWNVVNKTGVSSFENMLTGQLSRNGLINGTNTIRQSGTQLILSH